MGGMLVKRKVTVGGAEGMLPGLSNNRGSVGRSPDQREIPDRRSK